MITEEEILDVTNKLLLFYKDVEDIFFYYTKLKDKVLMDEGRRFIKNMYKGEINPKDMNFELVEISNKEMNAILEIVSTMPQQIQPGRKLSIGVKETTTQKVVGYIRMSSPILSIKPRNELLGKIDGHRVNKYIYAGAVYIPVQPFGYNCLGGKLMALIGCSHELRELFNDKYGSGVCYMETMSLYGDVTPNSQYDGLEPYIRFQGKTDSSKMLLLPDNDTWLYIRSVIKKHYGELVKNTGLSFKNIEASKILKIIEEQLILYNSDLLTDYRKTVSKIKGMMQRKRYYYSFCGFDNVIEHINSGAPLVKSSRYDDYYLKNLVEYWKQKAQRRFDKLSIEDRIRI